MPMDALTLGFVARELKEALVGGRVDKVGQPERDELIVSVRNHGRNLALLLTANAGTARAHLTTRRQSNPLEPPMLCMLARKHLIGGRVSDVRQMLGDRILEIDVENISDLGDPTVRTIVCEFMGKHSNLMLINAEGKIIDSARHVTQDVSRVREVLPGLPYERPPLQEKLPYDELSETALIPALSGKSGPAARALTEAVTGLSRQTAREIALRMTGEEDGDASLLEPGRVSAFFASLPSLASPRLVSAEDGRPLDVTAFPYRIYASLPQQTFETISEAMDAFYAQKDAAERISQKSATLRRILRSNIERCEKKLALQEEALAGGAKMDEYRLKGELLTACQGSIAKGQTKVLATNYYDPELRPMEIALDPKLSPAQMAHRYFKLYQKARSAQKLAAEQKEKTLGELTYLEGQLFYLDACQGEDELNEIRAELEKMGYAGRALTRRQIKSLPPSKPLHFRSAQGRDILVGKNNLQNDKLTQTAAPEETWLHAKDMPGSHVVIVGKDPDEETLYQAALLAAKYSKGGSGSNVPVDYTLRKYVKKPAGAKPGFVIYTRQRTLFVTPTAENLAGVTPARD